MPALRELQRGFIAALFDVQSNRGEVGAPTGRNVFDHLGGLIVADGLEPAERLDIYRNNLREGFCKALALEFPVIARLVGEDYFRQLAQEFMTAHPSRSGDLHHIGRPFAEVLARQFEGTEHAYFADVARLEWAAEESAIAPDTAAFDLEDLREIPAEDYADLKFSLHPACRLVRSHYPILQIWRTNQAPENISGVIDLTGGGESVLVRRVQSGLELEALPAAQFALLEAFAAGFALAAALEAARAQDDSFDLGAALRRFISSGVLTRAGLPEPIRP